MMYKKNITNRNKYFFIIFFICFLINISCKKEKKSDILIEKNSKITYAKGFQIIENKASSKLIISNPYQNSAEIFEYTLSKNPTSKNEIQLPISRIVVTSTTHIPMIELLNEENSIVGFPSSYYISSEKTRQRVDGGFIKEIGKENLR